MTDGQHHRATLNENESTLRIDGAIFEAVDAQPGRCTAGPRCAFAVGFGCHLLQQAGSNWCQPHARQDSRSIVWVKPNVARRLQAR